MANKLLKLEVFEPPAGQEWTASVYPHDGAFVSNTGFIAVVKNGLIYGIPANCGQVIEDLPEAPKPEAPKGVSEDALLKVIALALNRGEVGKLI